MTIEQSSTKPRATSVPTMEFVTFLYVGTDHRLHPDLEVALYESDDKRHVYAGNLENPGALDFDRTEMRCAPDSMRSYEPWFGKKHFGQHSPGREALLSVRRYAADSVASARTNGELLVTALRYARADLDECTAWAEARVRFLLTVDPAIIQRSSGSLASAIGSATQVSDEAHERWSRMLQLNTNLRELGREFWEKDRDERGAIVQGRPT